MSEPVFELQAEWKGWLDGRGQFKVNNLESEVSVPNNMGGPGIGTNPEELVLAAAANCYLITLAAILQFQKIQFEKLTVKSTAHFQVNRGPTLQSIDHNVQVHGARVSLQTEILVAVHQAEAACMISAAMKGNVKVSAVGSLV